MNHDALREVLKGILVTTVTPYHQDLSVDEDGIRRSVRFLVENRVNVLTPCGSIGEWSSLTREEAERVISVTIDEAKGNTPVLAGVGSTSTKEAAYRAKQAEDMGADGLLVLPAFYLKHHLEGVVKHFEIVANSTDLGLVLYNAPDYVGFELSTSELARILERVPSVVAVKDSTTDMLEFTHRVATLGKRAAMLLGNEPYFFHGLLSGSPGFFTSLANFAPAILRKLYDSVQSGDIVKARETYLKLTRYFAYRRRTRNPIAVVKQAMHFSGIGVKPHVRPPLVELSEQEKDELRNMLGEFAEVFHAPIPAKRGKT